MITKQTFQLAAAQVSNVEFKWMREKMMKKKRSKFSLVINYFVLSSHKNAWKQRFCNTNVYIWF